MDATSSMSQRPRALRVLSLDGGGVKGYTSLLILKRIIRTIANDNEIPEPKPCEIFDLIVGTSTGGLIATMLGRLRMSIDECIAQYEVTGQKVFAGHRGKLVKVGRKMTGASFYDIKVLQDEVRKIVQAKGYEVNERMVAKHAKEGDIHECKV